jgi:hypothetical protein
MSLYTGLLNSIYKLVLSTSQRPYINRQSSNDAGASGRFGRTSATKRLRFKAADSAETDVRMHSSD